MPFIEEAKKTYHVIVQAYDGFNSDEPDTVFHSVIEEAHILLALLDDAYNQRRLQWAEESKKRKNENNWVLDVLPQCEEYDLGYNYYECGICKICRDEGCPELAKYLCKLDFMMADLMNAKLVRTKTLAEGGDFCDFRYSLKERKNNGRIS